MTAKHVQQIVHPSGSHAKSKNTFVRRSLQTTLLLTQEHDVPYSDQAHWVVLGQGEA